MIVFTLFDMFLIAALLWVIVNLIHFVFGSDAEETKNVLFWLSYRMRRKK